MSNEVNDGGPAYPVRNAAEYQAHGMSLRDHFAGIALLDTLAQCRSFPDESWRDGVAIDAYKMADAMLRARATGKGK